MTLHLQTSLSGGANRGTETSEQSPMAGVSHPYIVMMAFYYDDSPKSLGAFAAIVDATSPTHARKKAQGIQSKWLDHWKEDYAEGPWPKSVAKKMRLLAIHGIHTGTPDVFPLEDVRSSIFASVSRFYGDSGLRPPCGP